MGYILALTAVFFWSWTLLSLPVLPLRLRRWNLPADAGSLQRRFCCRWPGARWLPHDRFYGLLFL